MSEQLLQEILDGLQNLNQRFANLEEGQKQVVSKVDNLDSRMGSLETKVDNLDSRMGSLETKVDNLDSRMGSLETKMEGMEASQRKLETRIENEVIDKIRILFDAHSLYMSYFASIKDSQARIEQNIEFLTRRNTETLMKALENEREIRLIRAEKK